MELCKALNFSTYLLTQIEPMFHIICELCFLLLVSLSKHFGLQPGLLIVSISLSHRQCIVIRSFEVDQVFIFQLLNNWYSCLFRHCRDRHDHTIVNDLFAALFPCFSDLFYQASHQVLFCRVPLLGISSVSWRASYVEAFGSIYS